MLPPGAFAVVLLVNGLQIFLPAPALVTRGRVWVPARSVLERLNLRVSWDAQARTVTVGDAGEARTWQVEGGGMPPDLPTGDALVGWHSGAAVYLPLAGLRSDRLSVQYDPATRVAEVRSIGGEAEEASLAAILADPLHWLGRTVALSGEYLGWSPYPYCYATTDRTGLPAGSFVLHNEGGAIYCVAPARPAPERASLGTVGTDMLPLTPYAPRGRRMSVSGTLHLRPDGRPLLRLNSLEPLTGLPGVTCMVCIERGLYGPGDRVRGTVILGNHGATPLTAPALPGGPVLTIASPDGAVVLQPISTPETAMGESVLTLEGGEHIEVTFAWDISRGAAMGTYRLTAQVADGLTAYPVSFRVSTQPGGFGE